MPIACGGILEEWGEPSRCLTRIMNEVRRFAPAQTDMDFVVDIAIRSWDPRRPPEFVGVEPGPVGRRQRRFILWHSVPLGLDTDQRVASWLISVLPETARLCREHLPTKSRAYPATDLAGEVEHLAQHLAGLERN